MSTSPRKGSLAVIFLTVFIDLLGFGLVLPLLPIYAEQFFQNQTPPVSEAFIASWAAAEISTWSAV